MRVDKPSPEGFTRYCEEARYQFIAAWDEAGERWGIVMQPENFDDELSAFEGFMFSILLDKAGCCQLNEGRSQLNV